MLFALIDTREPPPDGPPAPEPWIITALRWALPWPALVLWLFAASQMLDGWLGVIAIWGAVIIGTWRALRWMPVTDGMREYKQ